MRRSKSSLSLLRTWRDCGLEEVPKWRSFWRPQSSTWPRFASAASHSSHLLHPFPSTRFTALPLNARKCICLPNSPLATYMAHCPPSSQISSSKLGFSATLSIDPLFILSRYSIFCVHIYRVYSTENSFIPYLSVSPLQFLQARQNAPWPIKQNKTKKPHQTTLTLLNYSS